MPISDHVAILKQGVDAWNRWRQTEGPVRYVGVHKGELGVRPDLRGADLYRANLNGANLRDTDLRETNLSMAYLNRADLSSAKLAGSNLQGAELKYAALRYSHLDGANLSWADATQADFDGAGLEETDLGNATLHNATFKDARLNRAIIREAELNGADLTGASLQGAILQGAILTEANLSNADLSNADCSGVDFERAVLVQTKLQSADLTNCRIYGISAWELDVENATQINLIISQEGQPVITVDNIEVAQFVYLLLNRRKLRNVIETITSKAVLILGRFTPERKMVLDSIAAELRKYNLLPIIFDFERASSRDFTETIMTLAGMSLFVIADITNPSSAPLELQATVPNYEIPFVPILQKGEPPFAMFGDLRSKYSWVLKLLTYSSVEVLMKAFKKAVIEEAFEMHKKLIRAKADALETRSADDYVNENV